MKPQVNRGGLDDLQRIILDDIFRRVEIRKIGKQLLQFGARHTVDQARFRT